MSVMSKFKNFENYSQFIKDCVDFIASGESVVQEFSDIVKRLAFFWNRILECGIFSMQINLTLPHEGYKKSVAEIQ